MIEGWDEVKGNEGETIFRRKHHVNFKGVSVLRPEDPPNRKQSRFFQRKLPGKKKRKRLVFEICEWGKEF